MTYQHILVPVDGSDNSILAIQHAIRLAKAFHSKITIVQVLTLDPYIAYEYLNSGESNPLIERARDFIQSNLQMLYEKFVAETDVEIEIKLLEGESISHTLADAIEQFAIDLVVISSHGRSGLKKLILGSITQNLISELNVPIFVIKPELIDLI
ncbi:universal stress protein [Acinetobacter sp. Tr-809]|uniref:universal stress protein n=1 Tax=Acinetobacter sp. Tr-809 TaxID=2608324 RepID=UPI0014202BFD|nr:universal stress protein [Acinetobacter sp. Tr-809]NIE97015.1 universal stress protein [Acinetobacter sp. Tr-809]